MGYLRIDASNFLAMTNAEGVIMETFRLVEDHG